MIVNLCLCTGTFLCGGTILRSCTFSAINYLAICGTCDIFSHSGTCISRYSYLVSYRLGLSFVLTHVTGPDPCVVSNEATSRQAQGIITGIGNLQTYLFDFVRLRN